MRPRVLSALMSLLVLSTLIGVGGATSAISAEAWPTSKLRGGIAEMIRARSAFDQRVEYLLEDYREGELVYFVMLDGSPSAERRAALEQLGATIRWRFRAIDAYSVRSMPEAALAIARQDWVRYLYPVRTHKSLATSSEPISGEITRETTPNVHRLGAGGTIPAGVTSITVDLTVTPPVQPTFDFNLEDYPQATLYVGRRPVFSQPAQLDQMSFRYHQGGDVLPRSDWRLIIEYRNANNPPPQGITFHYDGTVTYEDGDVTLDPAPIPTGECEGQPNRAAWRQNPNLKRRGVTDIGAPTLWERGITGKGVRLAIADTGVDETHSDLDDQDWEHWGQNGCPAKVIAQASFAGGKQLPNLPDTGAHGSHVAGEAAGTAEADGPGTFPGVAPEAALIDAQIAYQATGLNDDLMAGMEWSIIDQQADVLNLSFGIDVRFGSLNDEHDPQAIQVNALSTNPAWGHPTMVIAAGNSGDIFDSVSVPGSASQALTVAASVKDWDAVMPSEGECSEDQEGVPAEDGDIHPSTVFFSSRGPSQDLLLKPDITAPGRRIMAVDSNFSGDPIPNDYSCLSGTSMAAPHAAGAASLLVHGYRRAFGENGAFRNRPPHWMIKAALMNTAATFAKRPADLAIPPNAEGQRIDYGPGPGTDGVIQMFGDEDSREAQVPDDVTDAVGSLVEGAGRVNLPEALKALTKGVLAYTAPSFTKGITFAGQPAITAGRAPRHTTVSRSLVLDPATGGTYSITFSSRPGAPSREVSPIPSEWLVLPSQVKVEGGQSQTVPVKIRIPSHAPMGYYSTYVFARVDGPGAFQQVLRLPVTAVVEGKDTHAQGVCSQAQHDGKILALQPSTFPGNPGLFTGASSDYPLFPTRVDKGMTLRITAYQTEDTEDELDLFLYGPENIVLRHTYDPVPGPPTTEENPVVIEASGLEPGRYMVALNNTYPSCPELTCDWYELPYHIEIDQIPNGGGG